MDNKAFEYTANQDNLRRINMRINSLHVQINMKNLYSEECKLELSRMQMAWDDVRSKMDQVEFDSMVAFENKVLTPAEIVAVNEALNKRLSENKDSNSI